MLLSNVSFDANNVYPDQTAPIGAVRSVSALFVEEAFKSFQQTTKQTTFVVMETLRVYMINKLIF